MVKSVHIHLGDLGVMSTGVSFELVSAFSISGSVLPGFHEKLQSWFFPVQFCKSVLFLWAYLDSTANQYYDHIW